MQGHANSGKEQPEQIPADQQSVKYKRRQAVKVQYIHQNKQQPVQPVWNPDHTGYQQAIAKEILIPMRRVAVYLHNFHSCQPLTWGLPVTKSGKQPKVQKK